MKNICKKTALLFTAAACALSLGLSSCEMLSNILGVESGSTTTGTQSEATSATYKWKGDGIARYSESGKYSYTNSEVRTLTLNADGTWNIKVTGKTIYAYDANATGLTNENAFTLTYSNSYYLFEGTYTGKPASDGTVVLTATKSWSTAKQIALEDEAKAAGKTKTVSVTAQKVPLETLDTPLTIECEISGTTLNFMASEYTR